MKTGDRSQESGARRGLFHLAYLTHLTHLTVLLASASFFVFGLCGCATVQRDRVSARPFDFQKDTFAFANELLWVYEYDSKGKWTTHTRVPRPEYWQHCFVLARATKQFFVNARFEPTLAGADEETYRKLIKRVMRSNARHPLPETSKIVIPGYLDLRHFSQAREKLLKRTCGSGWESYFQRGHWHVVIPFTRRSQHQTAMRLTDKLARNDAPVVHLVRFPQLTINHAVIVFDAKENPDSIVFSIYDPNKPSAPRTITYEKATRTFTFPPNDYFPGGRVDVYEIYRNWLY
jgi:hypothetical protein